MVRGKRKDGGGARRCPDAGGARRGDANAWSCARERREARVFGRQLGVGFFLPPDLSAWPSDRNTSDWMAGVSQAKLSPRWEARGGGFPGPGPGCGRGGGGRPHAPGDGPTSLMGQNEEKEW